MIDARSESLLSISDAANSCPGRPHVATVWRWVNRGIRGAKLETVLVGGRRYTSAEALDRFIAATTAGSIDAAPPVTASREKQFAAAENACKQWGV